MTAETARSTPTPATRATVTAFVVAAVAGVVHGVFSVYWGVGGTWLVEPDGGYDREGMIGHAWLWDPLFLVWGVALAAGLWFSRRPR